MQWKLRRQQVWQVQQGLIFYLFSKCIQTLQVSKKVFMLIPKHSFILAYLYYLKIISIDCTKQLQTIAFLHMVNMSNTNTHGR